MERSNTTLNERNGNSSAVLDKELIVDLETLEARIKVVFDQESIKGYEARITPGMSAEVAVEVE